ncbi:cell division protein ZapD [Thalassotalea agarivorans]|uniref:Cell division protein ZapD n=1 Tax=Thalassotalea agarivorans TaxID=349064 RepID=A0A1H9Y4G7_THASX|nr:cell division protein ZapD [Thalassotalea agarivorans]SES63243.1 cell division protein ZapD [Thalassotalea agarivorans]
MAKILYEHPLNQRVRNYLKLEHLFTQAQDCIECDISVSQGVFFNALFALIDTLERNDIRGDLIKDLEKLEQNLVSWKSLPDADTNAVEQKLQEVVTLISQLKTPKQLWWQLKDDKFLNSVKQRYAIQGGNASYDLPQLHYWLSRERSLQFKDIESWLTKFEHIRNALELVLVFIRQKATFEKISTESGFYQDNGEGIVLLRIQVAEDLNYYPTVSGNRFRYSIRFMSPCQENGRKYSTSATLFELAKC